MSPGLQGVQPGAGHARALERDTTSPRQCGYRNGESRPHGARLNGVHTCHLASSIALIGSAGFARQCSAPTTGSFRRPASSSASRRRTQGSRTSCSQASPDWSRARCRWPPANTSPSAPRPTPSARTWSCERKRARDRTQAAEENELTSIYVQRGLDPALARTVAQQLMAKDALAAHARDELGLTEGACRAPAAGRARFGGHLRGRRRSPRPDDRARAIDRAGARGLARIAALPRRAWRHGSADRRRPHDRGSDPRRTFWGVLAMPATAAVGRLFGTSIG